MTVRLGLSTTCKIDTLVRTVYRTAD